MAQITDCRISLFPNPIGSTVAYANITLDASIVIKDIKVINGNNGLFVGFPSKEKTNKETGAKAYEDIIFPVTKEFRDYLTSEIITAYNLKKSSAPNQQQFQPQNNYQSQNNYQPQQNNYQQQNSYQPQQTQYTTHSIPDDDLPF